VTRAALINASLICNLDYRAAATARARPTRRNYVTQRCFTRWLIAASDHDTAFNKACARALAREGSPRDQSRRATMGSPRIRGRIRALIDSLSQRVTRRVRVLSIDRYRYRLLN